MKIMVDVGGYNFSVMTLEEVIEMYKLNPIQIWILKNRNQITIRGNVFLERLYDGENHN